MATCRQEADDSDRIHARRWTMLTTLVVFLLVVLSILITVSIVGYYRRPAHDVRLTGIVPAVLGDDSEDCRVDMTATFEPLTISGRAISRYHRKTWWLNQCAEGALVEVTPGMIQAALQEKRAREQWHEEYRRLKANK